ncbi:MAG: hypothetical protein JRG91_18565 [Deltaproteobacteria bacterium]|nr:hypothetical protein [Deltaproteobacteria bacterium]
MRTSSLLIICLLAAVPLACSDDGNGARDATVDAICSPGHLRCDPDGRPWIQQCSEDGSEWVDHTSCDGLCHEAICYPPLDAGTG